MVQKLIRDKVPDIISENGEWASLRVLSDGEFERALRHKLAEEAFEVIEALSHKDIVAELADVLEAVDALCKVHGISRGALRLEQSIRREKRGGYADRFFLEGTHPKAQR